MILRCAEIDDLIGPYALDALEAEDRLAVLEHLSECRAHDAGLEAYRSVASSLPLLLDKVAPPEGLRPGLLHDFEAAAQLPEQDSFSPRRKRSWWLLLLQPAARYGIAAVLLVLVLGLAAWNFSLQNEPADGDFVARDIEQGGMRLEVLYLPDEQLAILTIDMPPVRAGRAYQVWQITDSGPLSLGIIENRSPKALKVDLSRASAVAVSDEPASGSVAPTTEPLLIAEL
jgi:anti-sigma-K factor RskA